jgi:tripartite-type tricarboxylate transporter receptor subunit TctC
VARAEPDGHTLLAAPPAPLVLGQWSGVKLGYDPTAFVPVTVLVEVPSILVVHPKVPVASFEQWIAYARAIRRDELWHSGHEYHRPPRPKRS